MVQVVEEGKAAPRTAPPPAAAARGKSKPKQRVVIVEDVQALAQHVPAWDDLAAHTLEPNPFYESWMLAPAWQAFGREQQLLFVFVYQDDSETPPGRPRLCGFFPLERRRCKKIPALGLWQHRHCFLCTPLIRKEEAAASLATLLDWAKSDSRGATVLELNMVNAEGPFHRLLTDFFHARSCLTFAEESYTRALWQSHKDADSYIQLAVSSSGRNDFRRKRKRLGEQGRLEFHALQAGGDVDHWARQFLDLEAGGWKGQEQTALAANPVDREYFLEIARAAFQRGQLQMLGLFLDGKPIALKCNFRAGEGAFVFKPAYDEAFAKYSPGALLEFDNMHLCHQDPPIRWMDSCTVPDHPLWNRLWLDRRPIQTVLVSTGTAWGDLVVSVRPLMRWFSRLFRRQVSGE